MTLLCRNLCSENEEGNAILLASEEAVMFPERETERETARERENMNQTLQTQVPGPQLFLLPGPGKLTEPFKA